MNYSNFCLLVFVLAFGKSSRLYADSSKDNLAGELTPMCRLEDRDDLKLRNITVMNCSREGNGSIRLMLFERRGKDEMTLQCDGAGHPLAFIRNKLFVSIDPTHPGNLVVCETFGWRFTADGGAEPGMGFETGTRFEPTINWRPAHLASIILDHSLTVTSESANSIFRVTTRASNLTVAINSGGIDEAHIGFLNLTVGNNLFGAASIDDTAATELDLLSVTRNSLENLRVPIRKIDAVSFTIPRTIEDKNLVASDAIASVVPAKAFLAYSFCFRRAQKLQMMKTIALSCCTKEETRTNVNRSFDERLDHLRETGRKLQSGSITIKQAIRDESTRIDVTQAMGAYLETPQYVDFCERCISFPSFFPFIEFEACQAEAEFKALMALKLTRSVQALTAGACMKDLGKIELIKESFLDGLIDNAQYQASQEECTAALNEQLRNCLTTDQARAIANQASQARDEYLQRFPKDALQN